MKFVASFLIGFFVCLSSGSHHGHKGGRGGGSPPAMPLPPKMEYFMASGPEDECSEVPEDVMDGWPMEDGCKEAEKGSEICMCVKKPPKMIKNMKMMMAMMQMTSSPSMDMMTTMPDVDAVKIPGYNDDTGFMRACGKCRDPCALKFRPIIPHQKKMMGNPMMKAMGQMMQAMKSGGGMDMMMTMGDADNEITA